MIDKDGDIKLEKLDDRSRLCRIWEKYLRNFAIKNLPYCVVSNPQIDDDKLDILIENTHNDSVLIVDAKWYEDEQFTKPNYLQLRAYCPAYYKYAKKLIKDKLPYGIDIYAGSEDAESQEYHYPLDTLEYYVKAYKINIEQDKDRIEDHILNIYRSIVG